MSWQTQHPEEGGSSLASIDVHRITFTRRRTRAADWRPGAQVSGTAGQLRLQWTTQSGARYQVERSADLRAWSPVGGARPAVSDNDVLEIDARESGAAFFRVLRLP